jgi:hypothetical protein
MGCPECNRLRDLFASAIAKHRGLREKDVAALEAGDMVNADALERQLDLSTAEINTLRKKLLDHEATHR